MNDSAPFSSDETAHPGRLVIISGPSGAGKSTVVKQLLQRCEVPLQLSVSATTREPRPGETHGKEYFFLSHDEFATRREAGDFLECKEVFSMGHWYGTLADQVATGLNAGKWVILEIDVQGALAVLDDPRYRPLTIFVHPGSMDELERRLRNRGTESESSLTARLETAAAEMQCLSRYQYEIINESVDNAVTEICQILKDQRKKSPCSKN
ncbi:guanylate kinase [Rhodopirellula halodulae]|uniref:guanylate kinase n=1 Tax=Rhodopirellula halodulae TaxID=2894198 RepID=UPI001E2F8453|nr:guanylate kinase [Rhodopirellula sp. JC737]MCC9657627.1 guanylate kinase [Rhodopirellula sp. JC737]